MGVKTSDCKELSTATATTSAIWNNLTRPDHVIIKIIIFIYLYKGQVLGPEVNQPKVKAIVAIALTCIRMSSM